ncbi:MAG: hypothetical protein Q9170_002403 [Blastenia crenularia]
MFTSVSAKVFSIAILSSPLCVLGAPVHTKQAAPSGPGNDFMGSLTWYPQQPDLLLASISNNSTSKYAILAKNNLFDDAHPYAPLQVSSLSGAPVALVGSRWPYPTIEDSQFKTFEPGAVWQRYFNVSEYLPPSAQYKIPTSECFSWSLPSAVEALNIDNMRPDQHLADMFLTKGLTEVTVDSVPIHMNATVPPASATGATGATGTTATSGASESIPVEPSGIILAPAQQSGSVVGIIGDSSAELPSGTIFQIGGSNQLVSTS